MSLSFLYFFVHLVDLRFSPPFFCRSYSLYCSIFVSSSFFFFFFVFLSAYFPILLLHAFVFLIHGNEWITPRPNLAMLGEFLFVLLAPPYFFFRIFVVYAPTWFFFVLFFFDGGEWNCRIQIVAGLDTEQPENEWKPEVPARDYRGIEFVGGFVCLDCHMQQGTY